MAVEQDQSGLLPEPPPPRPARRNAAIDAALRKFDGVEEPAPAARDRPTRPWTGLQRPHVAAFASAILLVVVGIPAALIGLRNQSPVLERPEPSAATHPRPAPSARPHEPALTNAQPSLPSNLTPAPALRKYRGVDGAAAEENKPSATAQTPSVQAPATAPAAQLAEAPAAPAPPPPPPAPPAREAASNEGFTQQSLNNVVVTGSRLPARDVPAAKSRSQSQEKAFADRIGPEQGYGAFLLQLQAAVRSNDRGAVIALIDFPLRVNGPGGSRLYSDRQSVERDFGRIFTPKVRRAILGQRADQLFVRDQGAMIGEGEVWFDATCPSASCSPAGPMRIRAINP
jgi:hypothetical protein